MKNIKFYIAVAVVAITTLVTVASCGNSSSTSSGSSMTAEMATTGGAADKVPDPTTPELYQVKIYHKDDDGSGLIAEMDGIEEQSADFMIAKLAEYGVVDATTSVNDFAIEDGKATIDLSKLKTIDKQTLTSIANSFIENWEDMTTITITVDGKSVDGGTDMTFNSDYKNIK